jgi:hypothetical protein
MYSDPGWRHSSLEHSRWFSLSFHTPYTDHEFDNLPHVILTSGLDWDPSVLDQGFFTKDEKWGDIPDLDSSFDEFGDSDFEDDKQW